MRLPAPVVHDLSTYGCSTKPSERILAPAVLCCVTLHCVDRNSPARRWQSISRAAARVVELAAAIGNCLAVHDQGIAETIGMTDSSFASWRRAILWRRSWRGSRCTCPDSSAWRRRTSSPLPGGAVVGRRCTLHGRLVRSSGARGRSTASMAVRVRIRGDGRHGRD